MTGRIENGRRAEVDFPGYTGKAGVAVRANGDTEVAFFAAARAMRGIEGQTGTIGGEPYRVISGGESDAVPGMFKLVVTAVTDAP